MPKLSSMKEEDALIIQLKELGSLQKTNNDISKAILRIENNKCSSWKRCPSFKTMSLPSTGEFKVKSFYEREEILNKNNNLLITFAYEIYEIERDYLNLLFITRIPDGSISKLNHKYNLLISHAGYDNDIEISLPEIPKDTLNYLDSLPDIRIDYIPKSIKDAISEKMFINRHEVSVKYLNLLYGATFNSDWIGKGSYPSHDFLEIYADGFYTIKNQSNNRELLNFFINKKKANKKTLEQNIDDNVSEFNLGSEDLTNRQDIRKTY